MSLLKTLAAMPDAPAKKVTTEGKTSLIKEFNTQSALKTADLSDAGSTDVTAKADQSGDISFNLMRNTINADGNITGSDVADYIERAEELNDEVDTVPFGLETDDNQIVKVYVNAEQADQFEEAMKNMLGMEDDIEEAINRLATQFDIVDVVWPADIDQDGNGEPDPDADITIDDSNGINDDDFSDPENYEVVASSDDEQPGEGTDIDPAPSDDAEDDDAESPEEPPVDNNGEDEEEETEEEDAEDDDNADPDKPRKKKKKAAPAEPAAESVNKNGRVLNENKTQTQENNMSTIGSSFLNRIMNEANDGEDRDGVKDGFNIPLDSQARAMAAKLRLPYAKRLVAFHFMVGVPGRYMNTPETIEGIQEAADMLRKKVSARRAFTDLYNSLAEAKGFTIPVDGADGKVNEEQEGKNVVLKLKIPKGTALDWLSDEAKEDAIFGMEEGDNSWAQNQTVETIEYVKVKGNVLEVGLMWDGRATANAQAKLQASLNNWAEDFDPNVEIEESLREAKNKKGGYLQKLLESVMVELGLPEALITSTGPSAVGAGVYRTAEIIEQDSTMERQLRTLAQRLGISSQEATAPVSEAIDADLAKTLDRLANGTDEIKHKGKMYRRAGPKNSASNPGKWKEVKEKVTEAVDLGDDPFNVAVATLVAALGIPDALLQARKTQLVQSIRQKKQQLSNRAQIMTLMSRLVDAINKNTVETGSKPAEEANESTFKFSRLSALAESKNRVKAGFQITIPDTATRLAALSKSKKEKAIFGDEEGDDSFIQNQSVVTVEYIKVKGNTIDVFPIVPEDGASPATMKKMQTAFDRWCAKFEKKKVNEAVAPEGSDEQIAKRVYARIKSEPSLTTKKVKQLVKGYDDLLGKADPSYVASLVIDMLDEKGLLA